MTSTSLPPSLQTSSVQGPETTPPPVPAPGPVSVLHDFYFWYTNHITAIFDI
jgi:hypothetical protein